jgi:hypothetical protein
VCLANSANEDKIRANSYKAMGTLHAPFGGKRKRWFKE